MSSLRVRLPVLAMAILIISLVLSTALGYVMLRGVGERDLQAVLDRERARFETSIVALLEDTPAGQPLAARLEEAGRRYLELNPSNEQYVSIVRVEGRPTALASESGPESLHPLLLANEIPPSTPGRTDTIPSSAGPLRSLAAAIVVDGEQVGLYQIVAPLEPVSQTTIDAMLTILYVEGSMLLGGGALLALVLFRSLRPLNRLATAARSIELDRLGQRVPESGQDEVGQLASEFNAMLNRLERASQSRQEFLASVSHELRTPITIARGHIETLERSAPDDEGVGETAAVLRQELEHIGRLVEDLMALARSEAPGFVLPRPVRVQRFFEDLRLRLTGLNIDGIQLHEPPDVWVNADPNRLGQAILNLIVNADVHTPAGTAITVRATHDGDDIAFTVSDTGPGIDPEIRDRVFEPFVGAAASSNGYPSSGLGLAVVRAISDAHDAHLSLRTGANGTEISLALPVVTGSLAADST